MSGARIKITVNTISPALKRLIQALSPDGTKLMLDDIGQYLINSTKARGLREVSPDGIRWVPLSPRYKRWKEKKRPGVPKLHFDFHMLDDQLAMQILGGTLYVGTNAKYGATHQFGRGRIPARPWLGISDDDANEIVQTVQDHIDGAISG